MGLLRGIAYYFLLYYGASLILKAVWTLSDRFTQDGHPDTRIDFPLSIRELRKLKSVIEDTYKVKWGHHLYAGLIFSSGYLFKQTLSLFGTVHLNILGGFLFGLFPGSVLCSLLQAIGSCGFYTISRRIFRPVYNKRLPAWLKRCRKKGRRLVRRGRKKFLLGRIIAALRNFPLFPNCFVNIVSADLGVPLWLHFLATFFGSLPYTFYSMALGPKIQKFNSFMELLTGDSVLFQLAYVLTLMSVIVLDPFTIVTHCLNAMEEMQEHMD